MYFRMCAKTNCWAFVLEAIVLVSSFSVSVLCQDAMDFPRLLDQLPLNWEAPKEMQRAFPFYVSGRDKDDLPVLVIEIGNWDIARLGRATSEELRNISKHACKFLQFGKYPEMAFDAKLANSSELTPKVKYDYDPSPIALLVDMAGFKLSAVTPQFLLFSINMSRLGPQYYQNIEYFYFVNVAAGPQVVINAFKPGLGPLFEKVEIFGTNKERWIPRLLNKIDKSQLPEWYGGSKNFKVVKFYG